MQVIFISCENVADISSFLVKQIYLIKNKEFYFKNMLYNTYVTSFDLRGDIDFDITLAPSGNQKEIMLHRQPCHLATNGGLPCMQTRNLTENLNRNFFMLYWLAWDEHIVTVSSVNINPSELNDVII